MKPLSTSMRAALVEVARAEKDGRRPFVGLAHPGEPVAFSDHHSEDLQGRSLVALYERGLVSFEVRARLTGAGKDAVQDDARVDPGPHHLRPVE